MATTVSSSTYKESYTVESSSSSSGILDPSYYKGIPGLLKAIEIVGTLVAYICVQVTLNCQNKATFGFFKFVALFCCITTVILYCIMLFKLQVRILRCDCAKARWPIFEVGYYLVVLVLFFFANLFLSMHGCLIGHKAGAFFGWFSFVAYTLDTVYVLFCFIRGRSTSSSSTTRTSTSHSTAAPDNQRY